MLFGMRFLFLGRYRKKAVGLFAATPRHSATSFYYACGVSAAIPNARLHQTILKLLVYLKNNSSINLAIAHFTFIDHH
jgi:hypothetical protein